MRERRKATADAPSAQYSRAMPRRPSSCLSRATTSGTPLTAEATAIPAGTRISFIGLHRLPGEKEIREKPLPLLALVEREHRVDDLVLELVERAVDGHVRGDAVDALVDLLPFPRQHELGEEQRRVGRGACLATPIAAAWPNAGCSGFQSTGAPFNFKVSMLLLYAVRKNATSPEATSCAV